MVQLIFWRLSRSNIFIFDFSVLEILRSIPELSPNQIDKWISYPSNPNYTYQSVAFQRKSFPFHSIESGGSKGRMLRTFEWLCLCGVHSLIIQIAADRISFARFSFWLNRFRRRQQSNCVGWACTRSHRNIVLFFKSMKSFDRLSFERRVTYLSLCANINKTHCRKSILSGVKCVIDENKTEANSGETDFCAVQ